MQAVGPPWKARQMPAASPAPRRAAVVWLCGVCALAAASRGEEMPAYFQRLVETANVRFEIYDPRQQSFEHHAYTAFQVNVTYRLTYKYTVSAGATGRRVDIRPRVEEVTVQLENRVRLPNHLDNESRWSSPLVQHEFDHVAMTADPRVRMLMEHTYRAVRRVTRTAEPNAVVDDVWARGAVAEELETRRQAVHAVLIANEEQLDEQTRHGRLRLENRREFFQSLFQEQNLRENAFPYLSEVQSLLRKPAYREAELPYRWDE